MQGLHKLADMEIETAQLRETLALTNTEVTRLKMKEKELEQAQVEFMQAFSYFEHNTFGVAAVKC